MLDSVTLSYDPFLLPTAQHRAGLAGLLVLRESLRRRGLGPLLEWEHCPDGRIAITLSRDALQVLIDDLYDGVWEDRESDAPPKSKSARAITPVQITVLENKRDRQKTRYRYQDYAVKAGFYEPFSMPTIWRKLWRDAIWDTLRGKPTTRVIYKDRANAKPAPLAGELWKAVALSGAGAGTDATSLSSSIFVGAQKRTAEGVPFRGRPAEALLLHFWPVVALVGESRRLVLDRKDGREREDSLGYVFAVPDVADISEFVEDFPQIVAELADAAHGYRPRDAVFSLPHEGALEYLHHVARLARARAERGVLAYTVTGVEIFLLQRRGDNIDLLATARVTAESSLIDRYDAIRDRFRNPLFRAQLIRNLLDERPWYHDFDKLFTVQDHAHFVGAAARDFAANARARFESGTQGPERPEGIAELEVRL